MKRLKIWICEDDESMWTAQKEVLKEYFPGCKLKHFENAGYAARSTGNPDFIIIDVGGIMGFGCDVTSLTQRNVEGLAELHPGAIFIVFSAIGMWAKEVYEDLKPNVQAISCWIAGCDFYSSIGDTIKRYT